MKNRLCVIITAAGSSTRMGGNIKKEYLPLNNGTVLSECVRAFLNFCDCSILVITYPAGGLEDCKKAINRDSAVSSLIKNLTENGKLKLAFQEGGKTRQASVFNGIKTARLLAEKTETEENGSLFKDDEGIPEILNDWICLIHDGARPFVSGEVIQNTIEGVKLSGAAVPGITPVDTQKLLDGDGYIVQHLKRSFMTAVQTPQGFLLGKLFAAHARAESDGIEYTDDTEIWGNYIGPVKAVKGDVENIKITYAKDYDFEGGKIK